MARTELDSLTPGYRWRVVDARFDLESGKIPEHWRNVYKGKSRTPVDSFRCPGSGQAPSSTD